MTIFDTIINKINTTSNWIIVSIFIIILISVVYIYRLFFIEANKVPSNSAIPEYVTSQTTQNGVQGGGTEGFTLNKDITFVDYGDDNQSFNQFYATIYQDLF